MTEIGGWHSGFREQVFCKTPIVAKNYPEKLKDELLPHLRKESVLVPCVIT
jgi:hypothetical protein